MDPAAAVNNAVEDGQGAAAPVPVENGGAAAPEPVAVAVNGDGEEAEEYEEDDPYRVQSEISDLLRGETYLTLETAKAVVAKFAEPGATWDFEAAHSNQDTAMQLFINGCGLKKYTIEEASKIALLLNEIGGFPHYCA